MGSVTDALPKEHMKKYLKALKAKKGFTLVEIMAVVALIAILFVIFIPRIGFAANKTKMTGVQVDMHSYQTALETTAMEHSGFQAIMDSAKGATDTATVQEKATALADAINSNLDATLQLDATGSATETKLAANKGHNDPWGKPYVVKYTAKVDATHPENITVTSGGPDGDPAKVTDNLTMTCEYNGTCKTFTEGFSVNMPK